MSFNNPFNGKSHYDNNYINRAPGSERRSATINNSYLTSIASNLLYNIPTTRNNSGELNLAPGSNRPYPTYLHSSIDSTPNTSTRSSPNSELSLPTHFDRRAYDLAPGSNRPSSSCSFGPSTSNIGGFSSRQVKPLNNMALISNAKPIALNPNESKACDTYDNGDFALSQCQDYNNSFYNRCVDNQRLRITCDHRIIKFSKDVRNVPHSLCIGSTQARSMVRRPPVLANYESCKQVATQMMSAVSNEERKTSERFMNELERARTAVCDQLEKYSVMEFNTKYNSVKVEIAMNKYFEKNIELLERRQNELLKYLEDHKIRQLNALTGKLQNFHEYNLKITQLNDALNSIQNSNNLEEMRKVNVAVGKEIRSLNCKINSNSSFNAEVAVFDETDFRMQYNTATLGNLRNRNTETTSRRVTQNLCRKGRAILGVPYMIRVRHPSRPTTIGEDILCRPWGACCDYNGTIYVADRSHNRIVIFTPDGACKYTLGSFGSQPLEFNRPTGIAIDILGRLIVADKDNHRIQIFTTAGKLINIIGDGGIGTEDGQFHYPWDVAVNTKGDFVVADSRNGRIQLFDLDGKFKGKFCFKTIFPSNKPKNQASPRSVCFTPNGDILVTDFQNLCVVAVSYDLKRYHVLHLEKLFSRPQGIICDDFGNIIVADSRENQIKVFRATGQHLFTAGRPGTRMGDLERVNGLCITPEGRIMVADLGKNRLVLY